MLPPLSDDPILTEIRERLAYGETEWADIRKEGATDMRYVAGDPWPDKERAAREAAGRPCLSLDELGQFVNQLINDVRQSKRAVKVSPEGDGANDAFANFRANLIRQIEYRSHAQMAYTTMFENAVQRSYGFLRIKTQYTDEQGFDQEIRIEPLFNPDLVTIDPDAQRSDGSDMRWAYIKEWWDKKEFARQFPKAEISDFSGDARDAAPTWFAGDRLLVSEYWSIETTRKTLLLLAPPDGVGEPTSILRDAIPKDDLKLIAAQGLIKREREVDHPTVRQRISNGVEVLQTNEWPGKYIPIVACVGKVLYVDDGAGAKRRIMSLIRLARDPYMLYCYYRTCAAELVGMTPKFPYFAYEGQLSVNEETLLQASLHEPVALIKVRPTIEGAAGQVLPFPQRQPYDPPIQALEVGAESARRAIQSAIGSSPLPTSAQRRNEKSGVALRHIEDTSARGSYHFVDHYEDALRHVGVIIDDLIPHIYDTARDLHVRRPDDTTAQVRINDPNTPEDESKLPMDTKVGSYDITISTGPSFESEREQASEFADQLAQNPEVFKLIGPYIVKLKNLGPIGDEIAKALEVLQPPELRKPKDGEQSLPPEVQQQMAQAQQMVQEAMGKVQELQQVIQTDQVKAQADMQKEQLKGQADIARDQMKAQADTDRAIQVAQVQAALQLQLQELKGQQALDQLREKAAQENLSREDTQRHEIGLDAEQKHHEDVRAESHMAQMDMEPETDEGATTA